MGPTKAPGPNDMNALFYQKLWHVVGEAVVIVVLDFLDDGIMLPALNYTNIVLIPKVNNLEKISDFRPISLCNIIYKIISKILANRLKQVLLTLYPLLRVLLCRVALLQIMFWWHMRYCILCILGRRERQVL